MSGSNWERVQKLKPELRRIKEQKRWTLEELAGATGLGRRKISDFLNAKDPAQFEDTREETLTKLERYVADTGEFSGFVADDVYTTIAAGMRAESDNKLFARHYCGDYCVLRAHVPSMRPLMSKLTIEVDSRHHVIRYTHVHKVPDSLSFFRNSDVRGHDERVYNGFVFNCVTRAFFLSTVGDTRHAKEMILNLRPYAKNVEHATMRGLLLTLSTDELEPFASRVLVQKMSDKDLQHDLWAPGLKSDDWSQYGKEIEREFAPDQNYGLLRLRA